MSTPTNNGMPPGPSRMDLLYFSNELPKTDLETLFRRLRVHSKDKRQPLLARFFHEATLAIKDEIRHLSRELKSLIRPFDDILCWAEDTDLRQGPLNGAVDGVLLVVVQLAMFIGHLQEDNGQWASSPNKALAALGVGLLTTTAVSLARTDNDLPLLGSDAVRLAFRMGVHVRRVSDSLESRNYGETPDTWAYVVHNIAADTAEKELKDMYDQDGTSRTDKVFLSAISKTSVTVSGPPQKLKVLFSKSRFFRNSTSIPLPVYGGLCHAPHIYGVQDVHQIIDASSLFSLNNCYSPTTSIYSTSTGTPYAASDAAAVLEAVISELLMKAIYWDKVVDGIQAHANLSMPAEVVLHTFGSSIPLHDLDRSLTTNPTQCKTSVHDLTQWLLVDRPTEYIPDGPAQSKLAVVGMSCRLPGGATNLEKFWSVLEQGLDVSQEIPADRFDIKTHFDSSGAGLNKSMTKYGCFIDEPGMLDAPFFNMSPREAQVVDPQMRLALVTAYEALEQSGFVANRTPSTHSQRIGTYYGQAADDYREVNQGQEVSTYYIPGGCRAFGPGRINYFFKFAGPSYSIDTACSSGLSAVEVACQALWSGSIDTAVTGGLNILTNPDGFSGLCNGHFLTKGHNACKTWDATADGYCRADGVVSFVIKRLEDAQADNDRILGTILGARTNHSADAISITHPHAGHQADLARSILRQASVNPLDVSYVELHGTGTQAGDYEEMQGVMDVYAPVKKRRSKRQPLHIGAVKSNFGHSESAAGATSLLKVLMMMQKDTIPRHIGVKTSMNPRFPPDLATSRHIYIPFEQASWPRENGQKRLAVVNSFGAAGGNTTMVLEDAPRMVVLERDCRQSYVITVSAKTKSSLAGNLRRLLAYLDAHPDTELSDLSYTSTARRYQHSFRKAVVSTSTVSARKQLASQLTEIETMKPAARSSSYPVAFAFTGQGAAQSSMRLALYHDVPLVKDYINQLDTLAQGQGFPSFIPALDGSHPQHYVHSPVITQLSLICLEIAVAKYWSSLGIQPDVVVGHSLGEYAAMHVAGVLSTSDVIFLVGRRAEMLLERCTPGSHVMMAVRASVAQIAQTLRRDQYTIACVNAPDGTVLSGTKNQMDAAATNLQAQGMRCIKLEVQYAFHSAQMDPILDDFEALAKAGVVFNEPRLPIISPLLGRVVFDGKTFDSNYLRRATREEVNFKSAVETAQEVSIVGDDTIWIEIGPHPTCINFLRSINPAAKLAVPSLRRGDSDWETITDSLAALYLAGVQIDWNEFHRPFESKLCLLDLPTYAFSEKNHWLQYKGDWCLTKGNTYYGEAKYIMNADAKKTHSSAVCTSTVQEIVDEAFEENAAMVRMRSDLMQQDFLTAANGHRMNDCGVVTSSIHADIVYTLGAYLMRRFGLKSKEIGMNIANLAVSKGLVAQKKDRSPQVIQVTAATADIHRNLVNVTWQNVDKNGDAQGTFATANLSFSQTSEWLDSWIPLAHLVHGRIEMLEQLAAAGSANRFSRGMVYKLFANSLVDYADKYRGMQSVVMHDLEGFADIRLTDEENGVWTVPPYFIDSVAHLAGFIMNCSDAMDSQNYFCITPGWKSMRFAKPLVPGASYRSYVRMIPSPQDPTAFFGDVYVMQENKIMGLVAGIEFHRYPRVLLSRFFPSSDGPSAAESKPKAIVENATLASATPKQPNPPLTQTVAAPNDDEPLPLNKPGYSPAEPKSMKARAIQGPPADVAENQPEEHSVTQKALQLIADETAMDPSELEDDAQFASIGVDSLMSLVIAEKLKAQLDIEVSGSLFLEYPTIGDMRAWLVEYYG